MKTISLRADCANCAALCCMALAFDRSSQFAIDKAAGQPCPHLDACGECTIHHERLERGFAGCVRFDCLGAGQRATQSFFAGRNWMQERTLIGPMSRAFGDLLRAHEHLALLDLADRLALSPAEHDALAELRAALEDAGAHGGEIAVVQSRIDEFLKSLGHHVGEDQGASPMPIRRPG